MSASEGPTDASGLTRAQLLQRGLVAGVAIGAPGVLADRARGATRVSKARHVADGWGPFRVRVAREQLEDLRRRLEATRLPSSELVNDASQGVQLATMQAVRAYWATRACTSTSSEGHRPTSFWHSSGSRPSHLSQPRRSRLLRNPTPGSFQQRGK